jgi:hypothetical protein
MMLTIWKEVTVTYMTIICMKALRKFMGLKEEEINAVRTKCTIV